MNDIVFILMDSVTRNSSGYYIHVCTCVGFARAAYDEGRHFFVPFVPNDVSPKVACFEGEIFFCFYFFQSAFLLSLIGC